MVWRISRERICSLSKLHRLHDEMVSRDFCKTEWTKPKHVNKPYTEHRSDLPLVVQNDPKHTHIHKSAGYVELWKAWFTIEHELTNAFAKNLNFFTTTCLCNHNKNEGTITDNSKENKYQVSNDESTTIRHVDTILRTYSELLATITSPTVEESSLVMKEEINPEERLVSATLNATTRNLQEEKLAQKLETIDEVPLVEAEPDIIKPPQSSGPAVINISSSYEDSAKHLDSQVGDDAESEPLMHCQEEQSTTNLINNYFEREDCKKNNWNDLISLNGVPDIIKDDEELSLMDLMKRVRERNRLLRCRDIERQLNASRADHSDTSFPQHQNVPSPPGWAWPHGNPFMPGQHSPMYPHVANPHPRKAEPLTPDNRPGSPGYNRATEVSPLNLALYLGPLVTVLRNAIILFPILTASLIPKNLATDKEQGIDVCVLLSSHEKESEKD
ncbi:uncharacterized protein LOC134676398 [Cydia fagiglandana]|uniref:uncharacterized protein LOC134676398 n=1 Tax=Cydia fagiglandana TaxID=1458189 RepID=UPI002FEE5588